MGKTEIHAADELDRDRASVLLASSEPWITLGITADQCKKTCHDPEFLLYMVTPIKNLRVLSSWIPVVWPVRLI